MTIAGAQAFKAMKNCLLGPENYRERVGGLLCVNYAADSFWSSVSAGAGN